MLANAKIWNTLYRQNISLNTEHKLVAIYCLFIGLEMLLKSYLMFLNPDYTKHSKLKLLKHDFKLIYEAISRESSPEHLKSIGNLLKKFNLLEIDIDHLRYPKKGDQFVLLQDYFKADNEFDILFDNVGGAIRKSIMDRFYGNNG